MQVKEIILSDGSGGLNVNDQPSKIKENEFTALENIVTDEGGWPGKKRLGELLLQYGPIDPQECIPDAFTKALFHLNEASAVGQTFFDSSAAANAMFVYPVLSSNTQAPGILPQVGPLGQEFFGVTAAQQFNPFIRSNGTVFLGIDNVAEVTFEAWVWVKPTMTGKPVGLASQSGASIITTNVRLFAFPHNVGAPVNGITIHRDWDAVNNADVGAPYFQFRIVTDGVPGTVTTLRSLALPASSWLFVRGTYSNVTGMAELSVNGEVQAVAAPVGAGLVDNSAGRVHAIGGYEDYGPGIFPVLNSFKTADVKIDEVCVSSTLRTTIPFKRPRGNPMILIKQTGETFLVGAAEDGLFATVGDGVWTNIISGQSSVAYWDGKQAGEMLYMSNGEDPAIVWDGIAYWPIGEPVSAVAVSIVAAGTPGPGVGNYEFAVTFFHGDAETGLGPASGVFPAAINQGFELTAIPTGSPTVTARGIYRRDTASAAEDWRFIRKINDNVTTSMVGAWTNNGSPSLDTGRDELPQASTGVGTPYPPIRAAVYTTKFPKPQYLLVSHRRLFMCGIKDRLYDLMWTEQDAYEVVRVFSYAKASAGRGPLIGLSNFYGEIHVSEGGAATLVVRGDGPSNWRSLEILHPILGCIDHFAFVHRTIPGSDKYELCFPAKDGFYRYRGFDFEKISEKINPIVKTLASFESKRGQINWTTQADFISGPATTGSATDNVYQPIYGTDGLREEAGRLKVVNQLEYLDLQNNSTPDTIALCKGLLEGEFFYSTFTSPGILYYTPDNFKSTALVAGYPGPGTHKFIEITRKGALDEYFIITSGTGFTAGLGMHIYKFAHAGAGVGAWTSISTVGNIFPRSDTYFGYQSRFSVNNVLTNLNDGFAGFSTGGLLLATRVKSTFPFPAFGPIGSSGVPSNGFDYFSKLFSAIGNPNGASNASSRNFFLTHLQKPYFDVFSTILSSPDTTTLASTISLISQNGFAVSSLASGFYAVRDSGTYRQENFAPRNYVWEYYANTQTVKFVHRENPFYSGGTFRPQAYWDTTALRLVFVAGGLEDGNGRIITTIHKVEDLAAAVIAGLLANTGALVIADKGLGSVYVVETNFSATNNGPSAGLGTLNITSGAYAAVPGPRYEGLVPLRLAFNPNAAGTKKLVVLGKSFGVATGDSFNFNGVIASVDTVSGVFANLKVCTTGNEAAPKATPIEIAVQTAAPYNYYVVVKNWDLATNSFIVTVDKEALTAIDLKDAGPDSATGVKSNMIFVPQSGAHATPGVPQYLWSDRLYFGTNDPTTDTVIQLGVPGIWRVVGVYESRQVSLPLPGGFDIFDTDYAGNVLYEMRNGTLLSIPTQPYLAVVPNDVITQFPAPDQVIQWRATLTWDYDYTALPPLTSPLVEFVNIGYFSVEQFIPRLTGWHWQGRSYWSVASPGAIVNDLVLVYQKNNTWTTYTGWSIQGFAEFRNQFVAFQQYQLVRLEIGKTDLGNLIRALARTGDIADALTDKSLRDINLTQSSFVNNGFPTVDGWVKITPYGAGKPMSQAAFVAPIKADTLVTSRQVKAFQPATATGLPFVKAYTRTMAIQYETSDEVGTYAPWFEQPEVIATASVRMFVSNPRYRIASP